MCVLGAENCDCTSGEGAPHGFWEESELCVWTHPGTQLWEHWASSKTHILALSSTQTVSGYLLPHPHHPQPWCTQAWTPQQCADSDGTAVWLQVSWSSPSLSVLILYGAMLSHCLCSAHWPTGHLHGLHPTLALARPGPGPDPPPTVPIPAALPDTARSQAAGPGKSQPADLLAGSVITGVWGGLSGRVSICKKWQCSWVPASKMVSVNCTLRSSLD